MKKNKIGFIDESNTKCKAQVAEAEQNIKDDETQKCSVPPHVIDEIEEHVLAKQEYEKSMYTLYLFKKSLKIILIIFGIIFAGIIFYGGYKYGVDVTLEQIKREKEYKNVLKETYMKGYSDAKANKIPEK